MADFSVLDEGSLIIVTPNNEEAQAWLDDNVITGETQFWGRGIVVEPRYYNDLTHGIVGSGFTIE
jgi:hypothetical protein